MSFVNLSNLFKKNLKRNGIEQEVAKSHIIDAFYEVVGTVFSNDFKDAVKVVDFSEGTLHIACIGDSEAYILKKEAKNVILAIHGLCGNYDLKYLKIEK